MSETLTWKALHRLAIEAGYGDDEYCSIATAVKNSTFDLNTPIWDDHCTCVACYAVVGGSEGYYVHVERHVGTDRALIILGKFWSMDRAVEFAGWATKTVYEGY